MKKLVLSIIFLLGFSTTSYATGSVGFTISMADVESTVTDEEIKKETKEVVSNINTELKNLLHETKNKFSEVFESGSVLEEE